MASHHEEVTRRFASRIRDRFAGTATVERASGPGLTEAVAWIECRIAEEHEAGDRSIVVAQVVAIEAAPDVVDSLVLLRGNYGAFTPARKT